MNNKLTISIASGLASALLTVVAVAVFTGCGGSGGNAPTQNETTTPAVTQQETHKVTNAQILKKEILKIHKEVEGTNKVEKITDLRKRINGDKVSITFLEYTPNNTGKVSRDVETDYIVTNITAHQDTVTPEEVIQEVVKAEVRDPKALSEASLDYVVADKAHRADNNATDEEILKKAKDLRGSSSNVDIDEIVDLVLKNDAITSLLVEIKQATADAKQATEDAKKATDEINQILDKQKEEERKQQESLDAQKKRLDEEEKRKQEQIQKGYEEAKGDVVKMYDYYESARAVNSYIDIDLSMEQEFGLDWKEQYKEATGHYPN